MYRLVLLRHGQSVWNQQNRFTGWRDVELSPQGLAEAQAAGKLLREEGYRFDFAYTSYLKRAIKTLWLVLEEMDLMYLPVVKAWQLNERHYGALTGLNKKETAEKHGADQVHIWRRSYDVRPPQLKEDDVDFPGQDPRYRDLAPEQLPRGECLKDTVERFLPYYRQEIEPRVKRGEQVIISAHGNSLRALVMYLDQISPEEILKLNIPTGIPLVYELDAELRPLKSYYLGDQEQINQEIQAVSRQGQA